MSETNLASIAVNIDQKTISATVERIVLQEIAARLGEPQAYFDKVVQTCVTMKVDREGRPSTSSYDTLTLIEYLARRAVSEFTKTIIEKWLGDNAASLEKSIAKALQKNVGSMAKVMADAAVKRTAWGTIGLTITPLSHD